MAATASGAPHLGAEPRFGIIGGSGVKVEGKSSWTVDTPWGKCVLSVLDEEGRLLFANRHLCTSIGADGKVNYAPPHEVNYKALIWALVVESGCKGGVVALCSAGTLHPDTIPVGSVVMADDYYMVKPEATTFWGDKRIGTFEAPSDGEGRIHYNPCDPLNTRWIDFRKHVQTALAPVLPAVPKKVALAKGQTEALWPCVHSYSPGKDLSTSIVYVNTIGPRFETRAEIRAYQAVGHVVGMTSAYEWALTEELNVPYVAICFCDNACNGLSEHPGGALQEYLEHKQAITDVTSAVVEHLVPALHKFTGASS